MEPKCSSSFVILAWYKPPKYDTFSFTELDHALKVLDSEGKEIILIGDTNTAISCAMTQETPCVDYLKHSIRSISLNKLSKTQLV